MDGKPKTCGSAGLVTSASSCQASCDRMLQENIAGLSRLGNRFGACMIGAPAGTTVSPSSVFRLSIGPGVPYITCKLCSTTMMSSAACRVGICDMGSPVRGRSSFLAIESVDACKPASFNAVTLSVVPLISSRFLTSLLTVYTGCSGSA
eukprot:6477106-Amphidinium_carterae.1